MDGEAASGGLSIARGWWVLYCLTCYGGKRKTHCVSIGWWRMAKYRLHGKNRDSYLDLVRAFPLVSIQSDEHLEEAQQFMDELLRKADLDSGSATYLDTLSDLVAAYEDEHHAIPPAADADLLRHLLDAKAVTQAQLSKEAAIPKSTISEVLAGRKPFSRTMVRKLADYFGVDVSVLTVNF